MITSTITLPNGIGAGTYLFTVFCASGCQRTIPIDIGAPTPVPTPTPTPGTPTPTPTPSSFQPITSTPPGNGEAWLDNGTVRVRVNLNIGGTIDYFGYVGGGSVINSFITGNSVRPQDVGRQKGAALYSGNPGGTNPADAYTQDGQSTIRYNNGVANGGIGYNIVQGGDEDRNPSDVVAFGQANGVIYIKTPGMQWHMIRIPGQYYIEQWVWLEGNAVRTHYKLTGFRPDQTQWEARANEFSYMYITPNYYQMWSVLKGSSPERVDQWLINSRDTGMLQEGFQKDHNFHSGEPWVAAIDPATGAGVGYVNLSGYGDMQIKSFGVDSPNPGQQTSDPHANESYYMASTPQLIMDYNLSMEYDDAMVLGNLSAITAAARGLIGSVDNRPHYIYTNSRHDVFYMKGKDTGQTPPGRLVVSFTDKRFELHTPTRPFLGADVPTLYVKLKYTGSESQLRLRWKQADQTEAEANAIFNSDPQNDQRAEFNVTSGTVQTIAIPLSGNTNWNGKKIAKLKFTRVTLPTNESIEEITIPTEHLEVYGISYKPENQW